MADVWLTQDAYDRLSSELEYLTGEGRAAIVKRVELARAEGDLSENGGYHAAREELGKLEGRVQHLKVLLRDATVGEAPVDNGIVNPGMVVKAKVAGDEMTFLLASREGATSTELDVYSERSPLGATIIGAAIGEKRSYLAPNGKQIEVEILDAKPYDG